MWQVASLFFIRILGMQALPSMRNQALLERTYQTEETQPRGLLRSETWEGVRPGNVIKNRKQRPFAEEVSLLDQSPDGNNDGLNEQPPTWKMTFCDENDLPAGCVHGSLGTPQQDIVDSQGNSVGPHGDNEWPADFCINVQVTAPDDPADYSTDDNGIKAIALIGGNDSSLGVTAGDTPGKCGNVLIGFSAGNQPVFGVQCNAGASDNPLGAGVNLTPSQSYRLKFCYRQAAQWADIYVDGENKGYGKRKWTFPRQGSVSLLTGSHNTAEQDFMQNDAGNTIISELSICLAPATTTTTTTSSTEVQTTKDTWQNFQEHPFAVQLMPRTVPAQRTATITDRQWPPDFCVNVVISTPDRGGGVRSIALLGGAMACGSFIVFFDDQCRLGMGVQCSDEGQSYAGSDPQLISAASVAEGTHALSFCYAKIERKASIYVDARLITSDEKTWNFANYGNVSIFAGSHINASEILQGVTMQSLSIVSRNPEADSPLPTDAMGNTDGVTVTLPPYISDIVKTGKGDTGLNNFSWATPAGSVTDGNGTYGYRSDGSWGPEGPDSPRGGKYAWEQVEEPAGRFKWVRFRADGTRETRDWNNGTAPHEEATTTETTTTFTTTTTTVSTSTVIIQHSEYNANHTQNHENTNVHKRTETNTVTNDGSSSHYSSHVEGR